MNFIEDINDPRLEIFHSLKSKALIQDQKIICETERVVFKALERFKKAYIILCDQKFFDAHKERFSQYEIESVFIAPRKELEKLVGFNLHHGILGLFPAYDYQDESKIDGPIIAVNGVVQAENIGSMIRNASGMGQYNFVFDKKSCHPLTRRCIRVSMGNVFSMNLYQPENFKEYLLKKKEEGYRVIGSVIREHSQVLCGYPFPDKYILIIGSEGYGMDEEIINVCDDLIFIPMSGDTLAFNASNAAAILMYEAWRGQHQ